MNYLLDTNIISETIKRKPHPGVSNFMQSIAAESQYLSVLTIGEIRRGIMRLKKEPAKQQQLMLWFENEMLQFYNGRILPISQKVADKWGYITGTLQDPLPAVDSLIAATALTNNLTLVTRNTADFSKIEIEIYNPWLN